MSSLSENVAYLSATAGYRRTFRAQTRYTSQGFRTGRTHAVSETIAGVGIPDSALAVEATDFVREATDDLLFHHSRRVFVWGSIKSARRGLSPDPEAAYVGSMFHDLGLTQKYRSRTQRFEVDGANLARDFLLRHGWSQAEAGNVWLAIALHTTPGVPEHLAPEVGIVTLGVETDVLGFGLDEIAPDQRTDVLDHHPRPDFKNRILRAFYDGMKDRPDTTFGTMNADVLAAFDPGFSRTDFVGLIRGNDWPE